MEFLKSEKFREILIKNYAEKMGLTVSIGGQISFDVLGELVKFNRCCFFVLDYCFCDNTEFNEFINKFVEKTQIDVKNVFNNVNTPTSDVKDKKIEWLSKQVDELTDYKNKIIEFENKFKDLNGKKEAEDKKYAENKKIFEDLSEKMKVKNDTYGKIEKEVNDYDKKYKAMEEFMKKNFSKDLIKQFQTKVKGN